MIALFIIINKIKKTVFLEEVKGGVKNTKKLQIFILTQKIKQNY